MIDLAAYVPARTARALGVVVLLSFALVACERPPPSGISAEKGVQSAPAAAQPSAPPRGPDAPPNAAFALPALDDKCSTDSDCAATSDSVDGKNVCCPGCVNTIASAAWIRAVKAACAAHPPAQCPAIGCAMALPNPRCVAGHCIDKK